MRPDHVGNIIEHTRPPFAYVRRDLLNALHDVLVFLDGNSAVSVFIDANPIVNFNISHEYGEAALRSLWSLTALPLDQDTHLSVATAHATLRRYLTR